MKVASSSVPDSVLEESIRGLPSATDEPDCSTAHVVKGESVVQHIPVREGFRAPLGGNHYPDNDIDDLLGQLRELNARLYGALRRPRSDSGDDPKLYRVADNILRLRRQRNSLLGGDLFGEPAWDMLLELYAAEGSGRRLSVSGACHVSGVPLSTALRWITRLEKDGWIRRAEDPQDKRRSWLELCDGAEKKIHQFLTVMAAARA